MKAACGYAFLSLSWCIFSYRSLALPVFLCLVLPDSAQCTRWPCAPCRSLMLYDACVACAFCQFTVALCCCTVFCGGGSFFHSCVFVLSSVVIIAHPRAHGYASIREIGCERLPAALACHLSVFDTHVRSALRACAPVCAGRVPGSGWLLSLTCSPAA